MEVQDVPEEVEEDFVPFNIANEAASICDALLAETLNFCDEPADEMLGYDDYELTAHENELYQKRTIKLLVSKLHQINSAGNRVDSIVFELE